MSELSRQSKTGKAQREHMFSALSQHPKSGQCAIEPACPFRANNANIFGLVERFGLADRPEILDRTTFPTARAGPNQSAGPNGWPNQGYAIFVAILRVKLRQLRAGSGISNQTGTALAGGYFRSMHSPENRY